MTWKANADEEDRGIEVLGSPIGSNEFVNRTGLEVLREKAQLLQRLPQLPSLQAVWLLLYSCAVPRPNNLLRVRRPPTWLALALPPPHKVTTSLVTNS